MKIHIQIVTLLFLLFTLLVSCAHTGSKQKAISISDIGGTWESIYFGYFLLSIQDNNKGYMIGMADENDYDVYKIDTISFSGNSFSIEMFNISDSNEREKAEGTFLFENLISIRPNEDQKDVVLFFMKDTKCFKLRERAKQILKNKIDTDT